jgi:hypothetical protein
MTNCSIPGETKNFALPYSAHIGSDRQESLYKVDTGVIEMGAKRPGRVTNHSPTYSADFTDA